MLISEIGRGAHGVVYKVRSNINGQVYALKKIKLEHLKPEKIKDALVEVRSMKKVKHKNIITYYNSFFAGKALYIVMEYAECGDMHEVYISFSR
jgi:NIMA (never in mitosis gene a)-related kinase